MTDYNQPSFKDAAQNTLCVRIHVCVCVLTQRDFHAIILRIKKSKSVV